MKNILLGGVSAFTIAGAVSAIAQQVPIAGAGYDQDFVLGPGDATDGSGTSATMDAGTGNGANTWYAIGFNASAPATGLPSGTTFPSQGDASTTFLLQPSGDGTGGKVNNGILVNSSSPGVFTLTTPAAYTTLAFAASTGNANNIINYTVNYSDGGTDTGSFTASDWFSTTGQIIAYDANGRYAYGGGFNSVNSGNPNVYQYNTGLVADNSGSATASITSIAFTATGPGNTDIQAISGAPSAVPEPSTWMAAGGLLLLAAGDFRRRRRA